MQGFAFNLRRPLFQDPRVRQALAYAFDFEWTNAPSCTASTPAPRATSPIPSWRAEGLPSAAELALLEPFRDQLPEEVFTQVYHAPTTEGEGGIRQNLRTALQLLGEAGWQVEDGKLVNAQGQPFRFEILLNGPSFERHTLPFVKNLERLGIEATVRTVDPAQYQNRMDEFDFDMTVEAFGQSLSPGNEQRDFWGSEAADTPGSRNTIGIKDPVVDHLIDKIIQAPTREDLVTATRALDRVLLWGHYVIPHWHSRTFRVAYWDKFDRPDDQSALRPARVQLVGRSGQGRRGGAAQGRGRRRQGRNARVASAGHAGLHRPPAAADRPDPVRDHGDQLRGHPDRARRAGRAADPAADRGRRAPTSRRG